MMEPMLISELSKHRPALYDLAVDLASRSSGFYRSLPPNIVSALADLVRSINCYYSNLIEGHNTHPVDIERALKNDFSANAEKLNLQLEAKAHIEVQLWIDHGGLKGRETSLEGLCELHYRFCRLLPDELLWVEDPDTGEKIKVEAGELRIRDVMVGKHLAISPGVVPQFMERFEHVYGRLGRTETILSTAAAHHRLSWIHPFLDGNGRVARLMSHAMLSNTLETGGIWSIARGLARNVEKYKSLLAQCDLPRRGDLDGRGNLSEEALALFSKFFLETCIDQIAFMEKLIKPELLRTRILRWAEEEIDLGNLPKTSIPVLKALLYEGSLTRGQIPELLNTSPRNASRTTKALSDYGIIKSDTPKSPWNLVFPAELAHAWMPGLFPEV